MLVDNIIKSYKNIIFDKKKNNNNILVFYTSIGSIIGIVLI